MVGNDLMEATVRSMRTGHICLIALAASPVGAEVELSFYGGFQSAPPSDISVSGDSVLPDDDFSVAWEGLPFEWPLYAGARATYWATSEYGFGLDYTHNKTYPQDGELPAGYRALEFTDGLNTLTVNAYRRWNGALGNLTPYVGGGLGISMPHVEVTAAGVTPETFGYQLTGPAATWIAGASMPISDRMSVFGEYKGTFSSNTADLATGGTLETDVVTNAVNLGVSFNF